VKMATFKTKTAATLANVLQILQLKLKSAQKGAHRGLMVVTPAVVKEEKSHFARRCFASDLKSHTAWLTKKLRSPRRRTLAAVTITDLGREVSAVTAFMTCTTASSNRWLAKASVQSNSAWVAEPDLPPDLA